MPLPPSEKRLPLSAVKILLTRPAPALASDAPEHTGDDTADALYLGLHSAGATLLHWPLIETTPVPFALPAGFPERYDGILFTSQVAVRALLHNRPVQEAALPCFAVGPKTAQQLTALAGEKAKIHIPQRFDAINAVEEWLKKGLIKPKQRLLWPSGDLAGNMLMSWLKQYDITLEPLLVYQTRPIMLSEEESAQFKAVAAAADCVVFTSPSAIDAFLSRLNQPAEGLSQTLRQFKVAAFGAATARAAQAKLGGADILPEENTLESLAKGIIRFYIAHYRD